MVIISKVLFWKLLDISKNISDINYVQRTFLIFTNTWTTAFQRHLAAEDFMEMDQINIRANSSLGKYHETKNGPRCTENYQLYKSLSLF